MSTRIRVLASIAVLLIGLSRPVSASPTTLQEVVRDAQQMLASVALQRAVHMRADLDGATPLANQDPALLQERVLNLLANAMAMAPTGSEVRLRLDPTTRQLDVWVGNQEVRLDTDREVRDPAGNTFRLRTKSGCGTELSTRLNEAGLGKLP